MKRLILIALALGFAWSALPHATYANELEFKEPQARPCPPWPIPCPPGPPQPPPPPPPPPGYDRDYVYRPLNAYFVGDNVLGVRETLGLGREFSGRRIEYVVLRARTDRGEGLATLMINNRLSGPSVNVGQWSQDYYFNPTSFEDELDREVGALQFHLRGRFTVEGVGVKFAPEWNNPPPPGGGFRETVPVRRQFQGQTRLELDHYINFARYQGYRLRAVILTASTAAGRGEASFCSSSGCTAPQTVPTFTRDTFFLPLRNEIVEPRNTVNWYVNLRGNFQVESITLEFMR
jgi:hypothetical protein